MTRKAVLLALSSALVAVLVCVPVADSYHPVPASIDRDLYKPVHLESLTREEIERDGSPPFPSHKRPMSSHKRLQAQGEAHELADLSSMPTIRDAKGWAKGVLSPAEYLCLDSIVRHESGWRVRATNKRSGAYGLPQALPGSKMAWAGSDWRTNPITQLRWMRHYVNNRYGSFCSAETFRRARGWY